MSARFMSGCLGGARRKVLVWMGHGNNLRMAKKRIGARFVLARLIVLRLCIACTSFDRAAIDIMPHEAPFFFASIAPSYRTA